ncbi:MAG: LLM class flavin-dependent oxidoreductase [Chloroflexota bacterium]
MQIGIGVDQGQGLTFPEYRAVMREAVQLGYESAWTPSGINPDAFQICGFWSTVTSDLVDGGIRTGISVVPVPLWTPISLAAVAGTIGRMSGGRFVLGVGSGSIQDPRSRQVYGNPAWPAIGLMREYLTVLRGLLRGEKVSFSGRAINYDGAQLNFTPPSVPVYLGALGEQMVRLGGELADGVGLNWCNPEKIAWSRERVAEGAAKAGRDPSEVTVHEYIRICVDEDEDVARRSYTKALMGYALARPGVPKHLGYRGHFAQMGFDAALTKLEERRDAGASEAEIIEAFPRELLGLVGYHGRPDGAAAAFARLSKGLDVAVVRVVSARPGVAAVQAVMRACAPAKVRAAVAQ